MTLYIQLVTRGVLEIKTMKRYLRKQTGSYRQQTHHTKQTISNVPEICLLQHFLQQLPLYGVSLSPAPNPSGFPLACEQDQK